MKQPRLLFANQRGFTLLEALVALVLFAIIILGSGGAIKTMLTTQAEMNIGFIVVNELQKRLQEAQDKTDISAVCDRITTSTFTVANKTFYVGCSTAEINISATQKIEWPILAASEDSQNVAQLCAQNSNNSCYVVGR